EEEMIVERVLTTYSGFQVRNVPIELKADGGKTDYQELVIDMGKDGTITRINLALQSHLYRNVMQDGSEVKDLRCRQMILDYVEQFRTAYNRKDIDFLENVFSDDALIITGKAVRRKAGDKAAVLKESPDIVYTQQRKHEYIEKLRTRVFPNNKYIHVTFTDIKVSKHPSIEGYYGVLLRPSSSPLYDIIINPDTSAQHTSLLAGVKTERGILRQLEIDHFASLSCETDKTWFAYMVQVSSSLIQKNFTIPDTSATSIAMDFEADCIHEHGNFITETEGITDVQQSYSCKIAPTKENLVENNAIQYTDPNWKKYGTQIIKICRE
ncbi:MAG: hypothetical protein IKN03_00275, partial [Fibrobacter sp.]|nr:hypothetical protein [Fibrobacter sp.]